MKKHEIEEFPKSMEKFAFKPFAGLFGDTVQTRVVQEIVADPYSRYHLKDFKELIDASLPSLRKALRNLSELDILTIDIKDKQHPIYIVNMNSKKLLALTLLSYAIVDDRDNSDNMDFALKEYCGSQFGMNAPIVIQLERKIEKATVIVYQKSPLNQEEPVMDISSNSISEVA